MKNCMPGNVCGPINLEILIFEGNAHSVQYQGQG